MTSKGVPLGYAYTRSVQAPRTSESDLCDLNTRAVRPAPKTRNCITSRVNVRQIWGSTHIGALPVRAVRESLTRVTKVQGQSWRSWSVAHFFRAHFLRGQ